VNTILFISFFGFNWIGLVLESREIAGWEPSLSREESYRGVCRHGD